MIDLGKLNPPQREAAAHGGGPLLVLAGAGSGKTRVITYRIANLIALGIPPQAICAVTFTNKAAEEMRERVAKLVRDSATAKALTIGTFHALGLRILHTERNALGYPRGFAIYDQADQLGTLREALRGIHDGDRRFDAKAIATRISLAKNAFVAPEQYEPNEDDAYDLITAEVYPRYQDMLRTCAAFDFDDLIVAPLQLFARAGEVARRWAEAFRFVMVDEFQDTNRAQLALVKHLVGDHHNIMVVGDDDQSIYSWRGADPTNILRFGEIFPGAQGQGRIVKLEQNYRSTGTILAAANAVIANNKQRHGKQLWSQLGGGEPIVHAVAATADDEARWVAREIAQLHKDGRRWCDVAVMYRSNLQSKLLEDELRQAGVPYVMYGGQQFFERKEVKDVIAYLRVACNPRDELALRRVINYPARGIGAATIERLVLAAQARHTTLWDALHGEAKQGIVDLVNVVSELGEALDAGTNIVVAARTLIERIRLYEDLRAASASVTQAQRRIENVEGLLGSLGRFAERGKGKPALAEYLRRLSLDTSNDEPEDAGDRVVLTTLHGAKGLEFPVCFLIGLEEELLPHARTLQPHVTDVIDPDHASDISEERRLCYVGITRAQRLLYLTRACTRVLRGRSVPRSPSRFLLEIPDELLVVRDLAEEARQRVPEAEVRNFFASLAVDD